MTDLAVALEGMKNAHEGYDRAEDYYEGDVPEVFASIRLRKALARVGMTYQFGFAATPVNAVVERLTINSITSEDEAVQAAVEQVWRDNELGLHATNIHRKACTFGDAYVFVWPSETDEKTVNVFYQDPRTCRVFYDPENPLKVAFAVRKWREGPEPANGATNERRSRVDLFYPDRIEQYVSVAGAKGDKDKDYVPFEDDLPNPFGEVPIFHFKTDADEYGKPEHQGFYSVQDAIHKLLLTHLSGVEYQSFNQRYALMDDSSDSADPADLAASQFDIASEVTGGTLASGGETQSQFTGGPDQVFVMNGTKAMGEFTASDPTVIFDPVDKYLAYGAHITSTPISRFQFSGGQPSGESLKVVDRPFVFKVDNRKLSFGQTWKNVFEFALKILGFADPALEITWSPSETSDSLADWQTAAAKQAAGVPVEQTLKENGYTDQQITDWQADGEATLNRRLDQLLKFGDALGALAPAQAAGLVTEEQIQAIVQALIGDMQEADDGQPAAD